MEAPLELGTRTVGQLVTEDFRRARVFKNFGIEFCCGGGIALSEACVRKNVDFGDVAAALLKVERDPAGPVVQAGSWSPEFLADYIVAVHHAYVREQIPALRAFTTKVARVHGHAQPELVEIADRFETLAAELEAHMRLEETVIFPAIKTGKFDELPDSIRQAEQEHQAAGALMAEIRELSQDFTPPDWACNTYRAAYVNLEDFETDLHTHVHLENNVLFPKVSVSSPD